MDALAVTTSDVDVARAEVGKVLCPHRLVPRAGVRDVRLRLNARRLGDLGVVDLDYGRAVRVEPGPLESFYLVRMPRAGHATVRHGGHVVDIDPRTACVLSPFEASEIRWDAGSPHRILYVSREGVEREASRLLGRPVGRSVRFAVGMDLAAPAGQAWRRAVDFLADELAGGPAGSFVAHPGVARRMEEALLAMLLTSQRNSCSAALADVGGTPAPGRLVRRARTLIRDHHGEALTVGDVAEALGVGVRTLQEAFRRETGTTPTAFLRECRMDAVRAELEAAGPGESVTAVALRHGFAHPGRFAVEYRARFGEPPSATLRR